MFWFKLVVTAISWVWLEFSAFDSYTSYFKESSLPLPSHKIILPLSLKSYLILKVHGWYAFGIKTRDENGINLMFPGIQHSFQEIFFRCFSCFFLYIHVIFLKLILSFLFTCDLKREIITSMCVLSECWWLKRDFGVNALI